MAEFERPRRKAMSDAELAGALEKFSSNASGIESAARLIAQQELLRSQDSQELEAWLEHLKDRDDEVSRRILTETVAELLPRNTATPVSQTETEPALFTAELPIITRRSVVGARAKLKRLVELGTTALLLSAGSSLVLAWLGVTGSTAWLALGLGVLAGILLAVPLKPHALHPILRSAAVFGGRGVYVFGGVVLAALATVYLAAYAQLGSGYQLAFVGPFSAVAVALVSAATLIGLFLPQNLSKLALALTAVASLYFLTGSGIEPAGLEPPKAEWVWGAIAIALFTSLTLVIGTRHTKSKTSELSALGALVVFSAVAIGSFQAVSVELAAAALIFTMIMSLVFSGRDLASGSLGRLAGLSVILGLLLTPFAQYAFLPALAVLVTALLIMLADQLARQSSLHIPSLATSFGFYGSFQIVSWLTVLASAGFAVALNFLNLPTALSDLQWTVIAAVAFGIVGGIARIPIVRTQDREIKNLDLSSDNIQNLLGL